MNIKKVTKDETLREASDFLSPEEVGKVFRVSKWTVRRWVEAGRLPAVRIGRRLLIPQDVVKRMAEQRTDPSQSGLSPYVTLKFVRDPAPRRDYFECSLTESEISRIVDLVLALLREGGWPSSTIELKKDGLKRIVLGEEKVLPVIWRYLGDGIERLLGQCKRDEGR